MLYCCREVSRLSLLTSLLQKSWWRRVENKQEFEVPRKNGTLSALGTSFFSCFSHTWYTPSISSAEKELREIVKHEAGEEQ